MFDGGSMMRFRPTPVSPGTGWFTREGEEHKLVGRDGKDRPYTVLARCCGRCGGAGGSEKWAMTGWSCYDCGGKGYSPKGDAKARLYTAEELAKLNSVRDARRAKKVEAHRIATEARLAEEDAGKRARADMLAADPFYADLKELMDSFVEYDQDSGEITRDRTPDFLRDMFKQIEHRDLSEKQQAAVQKFIDTRKSQKAKARESRHLGEVGERLKFEATVVGVHLYKYGAARFQGRFPGDEQDKWIVKFETPEGQLIVWKTTKMFEKGDKVSGSGTVKALNEFRGQRETEVRNCRIAERVRAPQEQEG